MEDQPKHPFQGPHWRPRLADTGSATELTQLMISWHNRALQHKARRRRLEREDEGRIA